MRRSLAFAAILTGLVVAACSDQSSLPSATQWKTGFVSSRIKPIDNLIIKLFPRGIETATGARWDRIDVELGLFVNGVWTGSSPDQGRKHTADLIKFIRQKAGDIDGSGLENGETREHAANRLVTAMLLYLSTGDADAPAPGGSADLVVAVVPAGAAATLVTPSGHAGLHLDAGSTSEERIIAITKNETAPPGNCEGPFVYSGCQIGPFYHFESLPHTRLNSPGRFAVCEATSGLQAPTAAQHDRMRLAHDLPASSADYTPGATQVEGIEILPLIGDRAGDPPQSGLINCPNPDFDGEIGAIDLGSRALYAVNRVLTKIFSPKPLYAYDQGPEHFSNFFSSFGSVIPPTNFVGAWNGTITSPGESPTIQPVSLIVTSQDGTTASGEIRIAQSGGTQAYNNERFFTGSISDQTLSFRIAPMLQLDAGEFSFTMAANQLTGTATEVRGESRTIWTAALSRGTTATIGPPPVAGIASLQAAPSSASLTETRSFGKP